MAIIYLTKGFETSEQAYIALELKKKELGL